MWTTLKKYQFETGKIFTLIIMNNIIKYNKYLGGCNFINNTKHIMKQNEIDMRIRVIVYSY